VHYKSLHLTKKSITIPRLPSFCFPHGVVTRKVDKSGFSEADYLEMLFNSDHANHPENYFVFLLTTEDEQVVYGVCIIKDEILNGGTIDKWGTRKVLFFLSFDEVFC
jgi:hypothetical protein